MKHNRILLAALLALSASHADAGVVVITHASTKVQALSANEVRQIFLGASRELPDGTRIEAVEQPDASPLRHTFQETVLRKNDEQLRAWWTRVVFTGKGYPPKALGSSAEVMRRVAEKPGFIGYVDSKELNGAQFTVLYTAP